MDEQIARQMFETVANEVVKYVKKPTSKKELTDRIKGRFSFFDEAKVQDSSKHELVEADVSFYMDKSKKEKIKVHVICDKEEAGVVAQGNVHAGEVHRVLVGVGNHMGDSEYYLVYLKIRNDTQSLPNIDSSLPSSLVPIRDYRFVLSDGEIWESIMSFSFENVTLKDDIFFVKNVAIDGTSFPIDASVVRGNGFQLFFELWRYEAESKSFRFDNRFVGIWVNLTGF